MRIAAAITLWFVAIGTPAAAQPAADPGREIAATVNGETISVRELDAALQADLPGAMLSTAQRAQLRAALLEDRIDELFIRQFLAKHGPRIDAAEIDAQMTSLKTQLAKQNRTLEEYLKQQAITETELRAAGRDQILFALYVKTLATDEKLKAYHESNRDHFDKVEVRASQILIRLGGTTTPVERAASLERIRQVRADLLAKKLTFIEAARKYSQCPAAFQGGDLGFIRRRGLPENEPLARAAFATRLGELSEIVETDRGFHLLLVTDRKPGTRSVLEKETVVEVLESFSEEVRAELLRKLRKEGQIRVASRERPS